MVLRLRKKYQQAPRSVFLLGKLEAIDYAQNLESQPSVDLNQMLIQIRNASEPYSLAQAQLLRARGYSDPVKQMTQLGDIRAKIKQLEEERQLYLQGMKETVKPVYQKKPE